MKTTYMKLLELCLRVSWWVCLLARAAGFLSGCFLFFFVLLFRSFSYASRLRPCEESCAEGLPAKDVDCEIMMGLPAKIMMA